MSQHRQADQTPVPRYKPYKGPAGGWGALISVAQAWLTSDNALKNLRMMLKTNKNGGFDCPGCAWGDSNEASMVAFCENGAKAVNWEATKRRVDGKFFAKHSVTQLLEQSDYWLEYQGRLTELMRSGKLFSDIGLPPINPQDDRAMLCGSPSMLDETSEVLNSFGLTVSPRMREPGDYLIERAFVEK